MYQVGDTVSCKYGSVPCIELKEGIAVFQLPDGGTFEMPNTYVERVDTKPRRGRPRSSSTSPQPVLKTAAEEMAELEAELAKAQAKLTQAKEARSSLSTETSEELEETDATTEVTA